MSLQKIISKVDFNLKIIWIYIYIFKDKIIEAN